MWRMSRALASFVLVLGLLAALACGGGGGSPASGNSLTAFAFLKADNAIPVDSSATISGTDIQAFLPPGTDVSALKASFTASPEATVTVGGVVQASGATANSFGAPVSYLVQAQDGTRQTYTVRLVTDLAAFDDPVRAFMTTYSVPAASIAVTHDGRLVYRKAYGDQDLGAAQPATPQSLFRLGSVSKTVTSVAVWKLIEQGRLHLGDTIFGAGGVLGTTYGTPPYGPHITEITLQELLQHTSGGWTNTANDPMFTNPTMTAGQLITWTLDNRPLTALPGTTYIYSNFGYCILGRVIEAVTGQTYEAAVKSLVLDGLGITDMTISGNTLADRLPGEVVYYGQSGEDPYAFNVRRLDSVGAWVASAQDLATLLVHVDGFPDKADILASASITAMTTPSAANANYACGWFVNSEGNWWHMGNLPGTQTEIIRAAIGWNWVILTNTHSTATTFSSDLDQLFWTAHARLSASPGYDLFQP